MTFEQRCAEPGELCTCGRQALVVYLFPDREHRREIGDCGIRDGGRREGPCPFCGSAERHQLPWGDPAPCAVYTLRPDGDVDAHPQDGVS